jgi:hypothetical protein
MTVPKDVVGRQVTPLSEQLVEGATHSDCAWMFEPLTYNMKQYD